MRHRLLRAIGFSLVALILVGICLSVLVSILSRNPNVGTNYYGLPIGTYSTAFVLFVVAIAGGVFGASRILRVFRQRAKR